MSTRKSISVGPPIPLDIARTRNCAFALSDIPRRLSANAAWYAGYIQGGEELEDGVTPNPAPRSPMHGFKGHTHSGGLDGRALFRSIYSADFAPSDVYSSNLSENGHLMVTVWDASQGTGITAGQSVTVPVGPPLPVFVPGCDIRTGAYKQLGWFAVVRVVSSANAQAGDVITLNLYNQTNESTTSSALTAGAPTVAAEYYIDDNSGDDLIPAQVGGVNLFTLSATYTGDGNVATRSCTIEVLGLEMGVYQS